jgi:hypothetical protein
MCAPRFLSDENYMNLNRLFSDIHSLLKMIHVMPSFIICRVFALEGTKFDVQKYEYILCPSSGGHKGYKKYDKTWVTDLILCHKLLS